VCAPRRAATLSTSTPHCSHPLTSPPRTTESDSERLAAPHLSGPWSLVSGVSRGGIRRLMATGVWELIASVRRSSVAARCLQLYGTRLPSAPLPVRVRVSSALTPRSVFCCAADDGLRVARGRIADASRAAGAPARFALYRRWRGACYIQYSPYLHQPLFAISCHPRAYILSLTTALRR